MQEHLGITPSTDSEGVLQDLHWAIGKFGYFPTYTLGTMMAAQQFNAANRDISDLTQKIAEGNFLPLKKWLNEKIHSHGQRYGTKELIERATGKPPSADDYIHYLDRKYRNLYGLK